MADVPVYLPESVVNRANEMMVLSQEVLMMLVCSCEQSQLVVERPYNPQHDSKPDTK
jgi:hypothetical protein